MKRVVELAAHAVQALDEPLEATALRPILVEVEKEMADDRSGGARGARAGARTADRRERFGEWDNVLLAHADRTRMFDDETRRLMIRKNGDVMPTILLDGVVAGQWWWRRRKDVATLEATPFVKLTKALKTGLERQAELVLVLDPAASRFEVEYLA